MPYIKGSSRSQTSAFPFTLDEQIAEDNPVRIIDVFIESLDLQKLQFSSTGAAKEGRPAYAPKALLKLYLYGYLNRIRTSRLLERECERNIEVIWLLQNLRPCFRTIAGFRSDNKSALKNLFKHFVQLLRQWNLVAGNTLAIDSSKFRAVNSKKNNFNHAKIERQLHYIDEKIEAYLASMEAADAEEDREKGDTLNSNIITQLNRKIKYHQLKEQLQQSGEDQISSTDADARSMILHGSVIEVAFNVQTAVDDKHNLIVHYDTTNVNDRKALAPIALETKAVLQQEQITVLADKGYNNAEQINTCTENNITTYVAVQDVPRKSNIPTPVYYGDKFMYNADADTYSCPEGNTMTTTGHWYNKKYKNYITRVKHYKTTKCKTCPAKHLCTINADGRFIERSQYAAAVEANAGRIQNEKHIYLKRQQIIEHIFGTIKRQWGYDHILLKGLDKNNGEFGLIYLSYNFKRAMNILGIKELKRRLETAFARILQLLPVVQAILKTKKSICIATPERYSIPRFLLS